MTQKYQITPKITLPKVLLAVLAGTVTSFLTGWVIYSMLLKGYFDSQVLEGARSVMRAEPTMWGHRARLLGMGTAFGLDL